MLPPTPVLMITAGDDKISLADDQGKLSERIGGTQRKEWNIELAKGHMDILSGESFGRLMKLQVDFVMAAEDDKQVN